MKAFVLVAIGFTFFGTLSLCQDDCDKKPAQPTTVASATNQESPFACDRLALTPELRKRHFDQLGPQLRLLRRSVRELPDGYEFEYAPEWSTIQTIAEWAAGERLCCPFFDIDLRMERESGAVWLRLTGREGTKQFIRADLEKWLPREAQ